MFTSSLFKDISLIHPLYFVYGLTFLFLGASIAIKDLKASQLKLSGNLGWLSLFGFSHGVHEWIELFLLINGKHLSSQEVFWIRSTTLAIVLLSFLFLLQFGLALLYAILKHRFLFWSRFAVFFIFVLMLIYLGSQEKTYDITFFQSTDIIFRRSFGLLGGLITGFSLIIYSKAVKKMSVFISRFFFYTGSGFILYAIVAGLIPSHTRIPLLNIPIEFFRGLAAILITYFLMKGLNIFDIETRNELEHKILRLAQSEKMASLGQLAAGIAHGINTPLTNASLSIQMMRSQAGKQVSSEAFISKLDSIERNLDRASTIAKELLQFSHVKETEMVNTNLNKLVDNSIDLIQYKLMNISIVTHYQDIPPVSCDAGKLEQVFVNILNNSIEAMPDGGEITIGSETTDHEVIITFNDTGPGIPQEYQLKAFDPFFTTKKIGKGTGLGLSICYAIIDQHNGQIELSGDKKSGANVTIRLPVSQQQV